MSPDVADLLFWIRVGLWVAAICTTSFPLLYLFSPWYGSKIGRALMLQGIAFAVTVDITLLFQYWETENLMLIFAINLFAISFIATASAALTVMLWVSNYKRRQRIKEITQL